MKRIGFERVEIEWQQTTDFKISRINFEVNNIASSEEYPNDNYKFINGKYSLSEFSYYYNANLIVFNNLERIPVLMTLL